MISRPIRTLLSIGFTYAFVVALVAFTMNPEDVQMTLQSDPSVGSLVALLPPTVVLLVIAGAAIVGVPIGILTTGVRRDLRSSRRRRQRRNQ
ncbi:hypothetical protein OB905_11950 [Halobacteria archaeon AArc-dxtr1]|nr:hypothetical protein [Halobacteria archaeon AArc-dxtr1]